MIVVIEAEGCTEWYRVKGLGKAVSIIRRVRDQQNKIQSAHIFYNDDDALDYCKPYPEFSEWITRN